MQHAKPDCIVWPFNAFEYGIVRWNISAISSIAGNRAEFEVRRVKPSRHWQSRSLELIILCLSQDYIVVNDVI